MDCKTIFLLSLFIIETTCGVAGRKTSQIPTKTIVNVYGHVYDCVHMYKQPAFGDSKFKNHKIQARPSKKLYEAIGLNPSDEKQLKPQDFGFEEWCTKGFVPIQRRINSDSIYPNYSQSLWQHGEEWAGLKTKYSATHDYYGAHAVIGSYKPRIYGQHEYSSSLIKIIGGESEDGQIIVGYTVNPDWNKDDLPRVFIGWTNDKFKSIGCYNLLCPGFVLSGHTNPIGGTVGPISTRETFYDKEFLVAQDPRDLKWWFFLDGNNAVGYWPHWLFIAPLQKGANKVFWGGVVYTPPDQNLSPQMGSGYFKDGRERTAHMRSVLYFNSQSQWSMPDNSAIEFLQSRCYFSGHNTYRTDGCFFEYGGKGRCLLE